MSYEYAIPLFTKGEKLWAQFEPKNQATICWNVCEVLKVDESLYRVKLVKREAKKWVLKVDAYPYLDENVWPTEDEVTYRYERNWNSTKELNRDLLKQYRRNKSSRCLKL